MSLPFASQQDLYDLFINTIQTEAPQLTDTLPGSDIDALAGVFSIAGMELQRYIVASFNKTFFDLANGPEVTLGPDDLQALAVDHFGALFARPGAIAAVDTETFSRPGGSPAIYGAVTIPAGTIVKTQLDANGNAQRYATNADVTMTHTGAGTDTLVTVGITAVVAGSAGDAVAGAINVIESTLLDPTITCTNAGNTTGEDAQNDATYRETIRNLIETLRAATRASIEAQAKTVPGIVTATAIEIEQPVIFFDPSTGLPVPGASYFIIPFVTLYVADSTGTASPTLIAEVVTAIESVRAYGVHIDVEGATPITVDWTASFVLNPGGPNYATLSADPTMIRQAMAHYIAELGVATNFVRTTANAVIMAIWGPAGSNDLTSFTTSIPSGDITISGNQVAIPGVVTTI